MVLGIIFAAIAAVLFGASVLLQHNGLQSIGKFSFKKMVMNKRWVASIVVGVVGIGLYVLALKLDPISTIQPVTSLNMVVTILGGVFFFKERIGGRQWLMLLLVIVGIVLVSVS